MMCLPFARCSSGIAHGGAGASPALAQGMTPAGCTVARVVPWRALQAKCVGKEQDFLQPAVHWQAWYHAQTLPPSPKNQASFSSCAGEEELPLTQVQWRVALLHWHWQGWRCHLHPSLACLPAAPFPWVQCLGSRSMGAWPAAKGLYHQQGHSVLLPRGKAASAPGEGEAHRELQLHRILVTLQCQGCVRSAPAPKSRC